MQHEAFLPTTIKRAGLCLALMIGSVAAAAAQQARLSEKRDLDNELAYQRGIEAVIWSMPAISIREFWEASFKDYGATWNDVTLRLFDGLRQISTRGGVLIAGACFRTLARMHANASRLCGCAFWL